LGFFLWARGLQHRTIVANIRAAAQKIFASPGHAERKPRDAIGAIFKISRLDPSVRAGLAFSLEMTEKDRINAPRAN